MAKFSMPFVLFFPLLAQIFEKFLQKSAALLLKDPRRDLKGVNVGKMGHIYNRPEASRLPIGGGINDPIKAAVNYRPGAHRAGLEGNVKCASRKAPIPQPFGGGGDGSYLRMA